MGHVLCWGVHLWIVNSCCLYTSWNGIHLYLSQKPRANSYWPPILTTGRTSSPSPVARLPWDYMCLVHLLPPLCFWNLLHPFKANGHISCIPSLYAASGPTCKFWLPLYLVHLSLEHRLMSVLPVLCLSNYILLNLTHHFLLKFFKNLLPSSPSPPHHLISYKVWWA